MGRDQHRLAHAGSASTSRRNNRCDISQSDVAVGFHPQAPNIGDMNQTPRQRANAAPPAFNPPGQILVQRDRHDC